MTRVKLYKKDRALLEKEKIDYVDLSTYKPKHLFTIVKTEEKIIKKPDSEIVQRHKNFDSIIEKKYKRSLYLKIFVSVILGIGAIIFAYFAFFYHY